MKEKMFRLKNSIEINVRDSETEGPTLLLLHFASGNSHMWDGIIPFLKESYRLIAPDLRGHGKSSKPVSGYHIDDMAMDIYYLLEELNIQECHIIGSSLGAEVATSFAALYPEIVLSIINDGAYYNEYGEYGLFNGSDNEIEEKKNRRIERLSANTKPLYKSKTDLLEEVKSQFQDEEEWSELFLKYLESNICETEDGNYTYCYSQEGLKIYSQHYFNFEFEKYYQRIKCPVLFLPSEEDYKNEKIRDIIFKFAKLLEKYALKYIEGGLHAYVWMQYPEITSEIVTEFIANSSYNV